MARLFAIVVTYQRPDGLRAIIESILEQDRRPDTIVIVDNDTGGHAAVAADAWRSDSGPHIELLSPGENLGPAGGTSLAMDWIVATSPDPDDWIMRFDDDKTVPFPTLIGDLERFAADQIAADDSVGAVGAMGSRYDFRRGRLVRIADEELVGPVDVDYVPTNRFPLYRVAAVQATGGFDARLFYGSSEVEFGLRLRQSGFRIVADATTWKRLGRLTADTAGPTWRLATWNWRRYYSLRNQIHYLRAFGHPWVALRVAVERGILKPAVGLITAPGLALTHLRWNWRAIRHGWSGRLGRTVEPLDPSVPT